MVFSTVIFLCAFLPITIIAYYSMPKACKNYVLLLASLFFYAWGEPRAVFVMLFSILCNYLLGLGITSARRKKLFLGLALFANLGILFVFKYLTFATENLHRLSGRIPIVQIALPIGISFYTFQGLSYVIDVYRGEEAQKNPFSLALYISMFPQLIAGPIVRYADVSRQLKERVHDPQLFYEGSRRFILGLAKKVILANQMGALADLIMESDYSVMSTPAAWLGTLAYTLQIYLDFSAYSDMAIGLGKLFGFSFKENFDMPYLSTSVREFWRRWHMSLSGWFRDYLYIPLGGSRTGNVYLHLFIVFLATGIWHGAGWGFLFWGIWHGMFVIAERAVGKSLPGKKGQDARLQKQAGRSVLSKLAGGVYTMLVVMIGWTLFRIVEIGPFFAYLKVLLGLRAGTYTAFGLRHYLTNQRIFYLVLSILVSLLLDRWIKEPFVKRIISRKEGKAGENKKVSDGLLFAIDTAEKLLLLLLLIICFIFMINSTYNPFIYFRF
ncbi:MAG: MBOAT family protein [Lachnospiraceae bacterium]|nr:MBOAT family protein [Lachnospiraceae bacterium]